MTIETNLNEIKRNDFVSRLINVINNISICPIVFNVYESLKEEIWNNPEFEEFDDLDW